MPTSMRARYALSFAVTGGHFSPLEANETDVKQLFSDVMAYHEKETGLCVQLEGCGEFATPTPHFKSRCRKA